MSRPLRVCVFSRIIHPGMGDLVQRNAVFAILRRRYPGAALTWVLGDTVERAPYLAEFVRRHSLADDVLICPDPDRGADWAEFLRELAAQAFDVCLVDPATDRLGPAEAAAAGITVRIAVPAPRRAGPGWWGALRRIVTGCGDDADTVTHPILMPAELGDDPDVYDYLCGLATALGIGVPARDEAVPRVPFVPVPLPGWASGAPLVGLSPGGATEWNRRWPPERFAEIGRRLVGDRGAVVVVLGAESERAVVDRVLAAVRDGCPDADLHAWVGAPLDHTLSLIDRMELLVGNDSGPAHLAAALGTPSVVLYGPTGDDEWARIYRRHVAVRSSYPCGMTGGVGQERCTTGCVRPLGSIDGPYPRCLDAIDVDEAWPAVTRQLAHGR